jgi:gamma-glutamyltranspeptidase
MYQDAQGNIIPGDSLQSSVIGYRSIATPGSVAGMVYAERKYGKLGLARVMAPAIKLAADGFVLTAEEAKELTDPDLAKFPDSNASSSATATSIRKARPSPAGTGPHPAAHRRRPGRLLPRAKSPTS